MATEQLSRRDNTREERETRVEKERVPQLTSHFEAIAGHGKPTIPEKTEEKEQSMAKGALPRREDEEERQRFEGRGGKSEEADELAAQFESLADKVKEKRETGTENQREWQARADQARSANIVKDKKAEEQRQEREAHEAAGEKQRVTEQNQPSLEEISDYRAIAQERSNEAIMAAKERYDKANKESLNQGGVGAKTEDTKQRGIESAEDTGGEERGQQAGLVTVKETLTTAAKTAKDYTAPIAEKAKDYTVQKAAEAKDITVSAGETTAHYLGEKAVAAKDVAIESGKVAAEYAGKAAEDLKDKAVVAGWSTAHYSCDVAMEGTKAAVTLVKGAAEYAGAIAAKPLSAAKNVAESTGESVKDYTARKKEEAQRESMYKQAEKESMYEKTKETFGGGKEEVKKRGGGGGDDENKVEEGRDDGGLLGAIGETIYEIAQTTKDIVIGPADETGKQRTLGFDHGLGEEEEEGKGQGYEKEEQYQAACRKEHRA